jgi:hypothetical protein
MQIERGTLNTLLVNARPTLTPSRWLLWFRDPERNASVYCLCSAIVAGSPTLIRFEETDTPTALNGQVKLSPPGNWTLKIYEQSSTTNFTVPARALKDSDDNPIGSTVITLADLLDNTVPNCPACDEVTLCGLITDATSEEVAICVISSGKRPGVLAEIIPTVPEGDTVAQVYDVMTPGQQALFDVTIQLTNSIGGNIDPADVYPAGTVANKVAPDAKVQLKDSAANNIGSVNNYLSGSTNNLTAPDGTVLRDGLAYGTVRSNGSIDVPSSVTPFLYTIQVNINGSPEAPINNVDPSVANTLNINLT